MFDFYYYFGAFHFKRASAHASLTVPCVVPPTSSQQLPPHLEEELRSDRVGGCEIDSIAVFPVSVKGRGQILLCGFCP